MDCTPFLRPDSVEMSDVFTDGAVHVIGRLGVDRFSVRAIARWMGVSHAAVLNSYSRLRLLELIVLGFERRWLEWSASDPLYGPEPATVPLRLPETPDERLGVQVLATLQQLAEAERLRDHGGPSEFLARLARAERELLKFRVEALRRCCNIVPSESAVAATMALITGFRSDLAAAAPVNTFTEALSSVEHQLSVLVPHRDDCITARASRSA